MKTLSVTELNHQIKALIEAHFLQIAVSGEISAMVKASSGHIYFTLKDENSQIKATLWKGNASKLKFALENGLAVTIYGSVKVYAPRGDYQIDCFNIEPLGAGALALAYEQLKKKLLTKGYFDETHKKQLPKFPKKIALVTSKSGAVIEDMKRVASHRWPLVQFTLFDTLVQGDLAAPLIAKQIQNADSLGFDIIVVARGGGSLEDLWCFNEEIVADAIFAAKTPVVSAIGHETDNPLSDFVADVRAPTPSAAMQLILPDISEIRQFLDELSNRYKMILRYGYEKKKHKLDDFKSIFPKFSPIARIKSSKDQAEFLKTRLITLLNEKVSNSKINLEKRIDELRLKQEAVLMSKYLVLNEISSKMLALNPEFKISKNSAMLVKDGKKISLNKLNIGDMIELQSVETIATAQIKSVYKN